MTSYVTCQDYDSFEDYEAPFDVEVDCFKIIVHGTNFIGMMLRGICVELVFCDVYDYNEVDLSGFVDLEIREIVVGNEDKGLLKILELKCRTIWCVDKKLEQIMNKYVQEESDPLMRDIQGFKLEMAVNGFGDNL